LEERRVAGSPLRPLFAVWLGSGPEQQARFRAAHIPAYDTEADAMSGLMQLARIRRRSDALLRPPPDLPAQILPDREAALKAITSALDDGRRWLSQIEVYALMHAYGIPLPPVVLARNAEEAAAQAATLAGAGKTFAVKIHSPDIVHKSDVDGVRLGLTSKAQIVAAAADILARARRLKPDARIDGVTIQPMISRPHARELIVGIAVDPTFGPVALFGHGGTAVEVIDDKALALLPLDLAQSRDLIRNTRISRLLAGYRNVPPVDSEKIAEVLVRVSRLVEDNPEIIGLDINPLLANSEDVIGLDARVEVAPVDRDRRERLAGQRFAVRPYPRDLEHQVTSRDGAHLRVRPMRPTDQAALTVMLQRTAPKDLRMRFLSSVNKLDPVMMARLTQLDYAREMAFVALDPVSAEILGVVRLHGDANRERGEYAILIRSDQQGRGIGRALMDSIIRFARNEGYAEISGEVLAENAGMLRMAAELGFAILRQPGEDTAMVRLQLAEARH
ncbi:MAG TPA: GNAT family N-acetyltransferase, partial [Beijerinckiaceae bacterium]|nr:GNAT family N-acetyltransferase [Beijerinckiaceae bacterium]